MSGKRIQQMVVDAKSQSKFTVVIELYCIFHSLLLISANIRLESIASVIVKCSCVKKYCDCYRVGQFCIDICRCIECKNTEAYADQDDDESEYESEAEELDPSGESVAEMSPKKHFTPHGESNHVSYHHHPSMSSPQFYLRI